jgi:hypothetical protein
MRGVNGISGHSSREPGVPFEQVFEKDVSFEPVRKIPYSFMTPTGIQKVSFFFRHTVEPKETYYRACADKTRVKRDLL